MEHRQLQEAQLATPSPPILSSCGADHIRLIWTKLAWMLGGAIAGIPLGRLLAVGQVWDNSGYCLIVGVLAGAVLLGSLGGGRIGRLGWVLLTCTLIGALLGSTIIDMKSNYGLIGGLLGAAIGLVLGIALELAGARAKRQGDIV
jgi:hypothetical protein